MQNATAPASPPPEETRGRLRGVLRFFAVLALPQLFAWAVFRGDSGFGKGARRLTLLWLIASTALYANTALKLRRKGETPPRRAAQQAAPKEAGEAGVSDQTARAGVLPHAFPAELDEEAKQVASVQILNLLLAHMKAGKNDKTLEFIGKLYRHPGVHCRFELCLHLNNALVAVSQTLKAGAKPPARQTALVKSLLKSTADSVAAFKKTPLYREALERKALFQTKDGRLAVQLAPASRQACKKLGDAIFLATRAQLVYFVKDGQRIAEKPRAEEAGRIACLYRYRPGGASETHALAAPEEIRKALAE